MLTKREMLLLAKQQVALDLGGGPDIFISDEAHAIHVLHNPVLQGRRVYSNQDGFFKAASFATGTAVSASDPEIAEWSRHFLAGKQGEWILKPPTLVAIDERLKESGHMLCDQYLYFLPLHILSVPAAKPQSGVQLRWLEKEEVEQYKGDSRFSNALGFRDYAPDMLAVAAFEREEILGMAGVSADSAQLWQVGIDILPLHRGTGLARLLVSVLTQRVLEMGQLPFYGTAFSHMASQNVAFAAGYAPAWAELFSKPIPAEDK